MMRRRKSDPALVPMLPGKLHHTRIVTLTDGQTGLYEATVRDTMDRIATSTGIARRGLRTAVADGPAHPDQLHLLTA
jgi:hypothetical protein